DRLALWLTGEMPAHERVLTTASLLWAETRAAQVTAMVRAVRESLAAAGRPVALSAAVFPDPGAAYLDKGQDWRTWAAAGLVDALYPMAYFGGPERVEAALREVRGVKTDRVKLWAGLGAYIKEPATIKTEAAAARRLGFDGICLFDLGSLRGKAGGCRPYVEAAAGREPLFLPEAPAGLVAPALDPFAAPNGGETLKAIVAKALGGTLPPVPDLDRLLAARWREFAAARPLLRQTAAEIASGPQTAPGWVELRGLFRYVDPQDGPEKKREQLAAALRGRERLLAGDNFATVAAELSQGGSRKMGGVLPRRWLAADPADRLLATLAPGGISPIIEVEDGFWCYQVTAKGEPATMAFADLPWPARRILFRERLVRALGE
ncbi:MAG: hypothetical protein M0017_08480, partial [Desulfobacteraceae bacterium]|nr:hypothetical protein [Desulfobacteraceae bacterium]